jgi:VanZ family protein
VLVTVLLCLPGTEFPKISWLDNIWFDKWVHIGLFLVLVITWFMFFSKKLSPEVSIQKILLLVTVSCIAYGVLMELVQHFFIPFRSFDVWDIVADGAGSLVGFFYSGRYIKK